MSTAQSFSNEQLTYETLESDWGKDPLIKIVTSRFKSGVYLSKANFPENKRNGKDNTIPTSPAEETSLRLIEGGKKPKGNYRQGDSKYHPVKPRAKLTDPMAGLQVYQDNYNIFAESKEIVDNQLEMKFLEVQS